MSAPRRGIAFRLATIALLAAFTVSGFDASAEQAPAGTTAPNDGPAVDERGTYTSTEGPAVAQLDGSANDPTAGVPTDVPLSGLVYEGLKRVNKKRSRCGAGYEGRTRDGKRVCSHGPDAAPRGVDVRRRARVKDLKAMATTATTSGTAPSLPCYGDGVSGSRIQAIYARASDVPDRSSSIASLIPQWAANVDAAFDESAKQTGGRRHVSWVTDAGCVLNVATAVLSPTGDDSLTNTISELKAMGYTRTDRKYLVWTDAAQYCGIAEILNDDQPGSSNANNFGPTFGRVDSACWGSSNSTEAHELMHMLGGIQLSAPHSTGAWHCTDENDRMCLPEEGKALSFGCAPGNEPFFDCGHDDYYSTAPSPGSYLSTHWNSANSAFLSAATPDACTTTSSVASEPTKRRRRRGRKRHAERPATGPAPVGPCLPV